MKKLLRLFTHCHSGVALLEFGIVLPFLLAMLVGMTEIARYAIIIQKLDKTTNSLADYVTQGTVVCQSDLDVFAAAANDIMAPFSFSGTIIFTSVVNKVNAPPCLATKVGACASWQYRPVGNDPSQVAQGQGASAFIAGYTLPEGQNVIVAETVYNFTPMLTISGTIIPHLSPEKLYKVAVFKPRQRSLTQLCTN